MNDSTKPWRIIRADYHNPLHAQTIISLLDEYASGPSGSGEPLSTDVKAELIPALRRTPTALTLLAFAGDAPIGLLNAFETLSTFKAKPLINIHDIAVTASWRRKGVGRALMQAIEVVAHERGCCKLTLEVLENNVSAQALYRELGFADYSLLPEMGSAVFMQKML